MRKIISVPSILIFSLLLISCNKNIENQSSYTKNQIEQSYSIKPESSDNLANTFIKVISNNTSSNDIILDIFIDDTLFVKETISQNSKNTINYAYKLADKDHSLKVLVNGVNKFTIPLTNNFKRQFVNINYDSKNTLSEVTVSVSDYFH